MKSCQEQLIFFILPFIVQQNFAPGKHGTVPPPCPPQAAQGGRGPADPILQRGVRQSWYGRGAFPKPMYSGVRSIFSAGTGDVSTKFCMMVVKKRKSSTRARPSPRQERFPVRWSEEKWSLLSVKLLHFLQQTEASQGQIMRSTCSGHYLAPLMVLPEEGILTAAALHPHSF